MRLLMLSTDRKLLDPESSVVARTLKYAARMDSFTIVLAGVGERREFMLGPVRVVYPGGASKAHNFFTMLRASYAEARRLQPTVVTIQDPFFVGVIGVCVSYFVRAPLQVQIHTDYFSRGFIFESVRHFIQFFLSVIVLPFASCVRVVSKSLAKRVRRYTQAPISVLPVFFTMPAREPLPRPPEFERAPVLLVVSRLVRQKGIHHVIAALARIEDVHLYIIGDGPDKAFFERQARVSGVSERVHFLGWKNDLAPYYQHADCFIQASSYEGYGMALYEAVLSGCPAVSTGVGVASELPSACVTLCDRSEYALARAIRTTLHQSPEVRSSRESARASLLSLVPTEDQYADQYITLLKTCGS